MKKFNKGLALSLSKGFTLIELLIVIALLGALAVGLLAALDPFEQLKKGTDTGVRNTVVELQSASIRYYAIKNYMPWCADATCLTFRDGDDNDYTTATTGTAWSTATTGTIVEIESTGELKIGFSTIAGSGTMAKINIFGSNATQQIKVCYKPTAKSFINDPNTKYNADTGTEEVAGTCKGQGGTDLTCLWCVQ